MAAFVFTARTVILGTVWTGVAPGPTVVTPSGTVASVLTLTSYITDGGDISYAANMVDTTNMGSLGYTTKIPGLTSGDDIVLNMNADEAASSLAVGVRTLGGVARPGSSPIYIDTMPTSSARSATNPSSVAAVYISKWQPRAGSVGGKANAQLTLTITGTFVELTS